MDLKAAQAWFRGCSPHQKAIALLDIMFHLTLTMRGISVYLADDCETRWRLAYHLSEMNHAFTRAASAMMQGEETYPADVLIEILVDQSNYPELESECWIALNTVMQRHKDQA